MVQYKLGSHEVKVPKLRHIGPFEKEMVIQNTPLLLDWTTIGRLGHPCGFHDMNTRVLKNRI